MSFAHGERLMKGENEGSHCLRHLAKLPSTGMIGTVRGSDLASYPAAGQRVPT